MLKLTYFLFISIGSQMQVVGPFEGLIACELAARQVQIAVFEGTSFLSPNPLVGTACLNTRHSNFRFREPSKKE